jgi:hypothetical protein
MSFIAARWCCAKLRTCSCANLMSSSSRFESCDRQSLISAIVLAVPLVELDRELAHGLVAAFFDVGENRLDSCAGLGVVFGACRGILAALDIFGHSQFPLYLIVMRSFEGHGSIGDSAPPDRCSGGAVKTSSRTLSRARFPSVSCDGKSRPWKCQSQE